MRGDSLRDFYAKTLAVLGLGLIAGAGAIVDYWPTGQRLPDTTSPEIARITVPALAQNLDQQVPAPQLPASRPAVRSMNARHVSWPAFTPKVAPVTTVAIAAPAPVSPSPAVEVSPVASSDRMVSYVTPINDWAPHVVLASSLAPEVLDDSPAVPPAGFISGALKKTKESLAKTGAVTRDSIADAVRGVVGAFKKVSPF